MDCVNGLCRRPDSHPIPIVVIQVMHFATMARNKLHDAYGNAAEDYVRTQAQEACFAARAQACGSVCRRAMGDALLALHVDPPPGQRVAVFDWWRQVWTRFAELNAVAPPAVIEKTPLQPQSSREVCAQLAGWAVGTLLANSAKARYAVLLQSVKVKLPEQPGTLATIEPAIRFVLARQHFGGLTAVNTSMINAFTAAQSIMVVNLTPELMAKHGGQAYGLAVETAKADMGVRAAFEVRHVHVRD